MSQPQQRLPGTTYFITQRCDRRELRLPPTGETSAAIAVALFEASMRHHVGIVAVSAPGNHLHLVVYDEFGNLSEFMRDAFALLARFGNARDGVVGQNFWNSQPAVAVALGDAATVVEKVAYVMANPVTSFLVPRLEDWPGLKLEVADLGRLRGPVYRRPEVFFQKGGWVSEEVQVISELPPMVERAYGVEGFQRRVKREVEVLIEAAHAEARSRGHGFVGIAKILRQSVWDKPTTPNQRTAGWATAVIRRVAAATNQRVRAMAEALAAFQAAHRAAWEALQRGVRRRFPAGTFQAWRFYGVERDPVRAPWATCPAPSD